jgi:hypothetical protein
MRLRARSKTGQNWLLPGEGRGGLAGAPVKAGGVRHRRGGFLVWWA